VNRLSQTEVIEGLRKRDNGVLRFIYKTGFLSIRNMVMVNNGTEEDAKDIFQESLIIAFRKFKENENYTIRCSFQTYIYSIARHLWLKHLRISRDNLKNFKENHDFIEFEEPEPASAEELRFALYQKVFMELPPDCQKIMKLSLDGVSHKEIASMLGYKSENYIGKRKHFCKEYLIKRIKENPEFQSAE
jgi:RNA polymerase sigma factor (sigma-70 family)